jgi:magnesium transporter
MSVDRPHPATAAITTEELRDLWPILTAEERLDGLNLLRRPEAEDFYLELSAADQCALVRALPVAERRMWLRLLAPDDVVDLIQNAPPEERAGMVALLDEVTQHDAAALMAFAEDEAGGLMNPRYARLRPDMTVYEAIGYLRKQVGTQAATISYAYVVDAAQHLLGVVSFAQLLAAPNERLVRDIMRADVVTVPEDMDQEAVGRVLAQYNFVAVPVVDAEKRMKGIVTADDVLDVVEEEATEDIQKLGGTIALDAPYLRTSVLGMVKKRVGWLAVLLVSEMATASVMAHFEGSLQRLIFLVTFVPLIMSSGGNSGSQASTLVIRAMALGEVHLADWWRVLRHEIATGAVLGLVLGLLGAARVFLWDSLFAVYQPHTPEVAFVLGITIAGVVTWGSIVGSMLPFLLRRLRLDPASASAPFVATLVDVTGILIYFLTATAVLGEVLR